MGMKVKPSGVRKYISRTLLSKGLSCIPGSVLLNPFGGLTMSERDKLADAMKKELENYTLGKYDYKDRKGKTMTEVIDQIDLEVKGQKIKEERWSKK